MFTEGVVDALREHGIMVDGTIGVSAGALFGCNYKSHQTGRALRYNTRFKDDPRYMGLRSFIKTGNYINTEFAYNKVPLEYDIIDNDTFMADPSEFYVVCTDIETGQPVYKQIHSIDADTLHWFRATGSMPIVSTPVELEGMKLLDGGMTDCIPLRYFQSIGYDRNIVVLTQPREYIKKKSHITFLFRKCYPQYPMIAQCMSQRHIMYNMQRQYVAQQAEEGKIIAIYPDKPLAIGRTELNAHKMQAIYNHGYEVAMRHLNDIRRFMTK